MDVLPPELLTDIVRFTVFSDLPDEPPVDRGSLSRSYYSSILSLVTVSKKFYDITMPVLLRTVILSSEADVASFTQTVREQQRSPKVGSRIKPEYTKHIRRFWCTYCYEPLPSDAKTPDYGILAEIMSNAISLGLNLLSLHLLYKAVEMEPSRHWSCQRVTLAGNNLRWNPLTSNPGGLRFLGQITHLILWVAGNGTHEESPLPNWVQEIPFHLMHSLTHFACPLRLRGLPQVHAELPRDMVIYTTSQWEHTKSPSTFRQWVMDDEHLVHGVVVPLPTLPSITDDAGTGFFWEHVYWQGWSDDAWKVKKLSESKINED